MPKFPIYTHTGMAFHKDQYKDHNNKDQDNNRGKKQSNNSVVARRKRIQNNNRYNYKHAPQNNLAFNSENVLSKSVNPYERYFAALLRSSPQEYIDSTVTRNYSSNDSNNKNDNKNNDLWTTICHRVNLRPLLETHESIKAKYQSVDEHFGVRASLVLEESRHAIAEALAQRYRLVSLNGRNKMSNKHSNNNTIPKPSRATMPVKCVAMAHLDDKVEGYTLKFCLLQHKNLKKRFTKEQLFHMRPGTVFQVVWKNDNKVSSMNNCSSIEQTTTLACFAHSNREELEQQATFSVMIFRDISTLSRENNTNVEMDNTNNSSSSNSSTAYLNQSFEVTPLVGLISELRQFDACTSKDTKKVPFVNALMGHWPRHIRFQDDDDDDDDDDGDDDVDVNDDNNGHQAENDNIEKQKVYVESIKEQQEEDETTKPQVEATLELGSEVSASEDYYMDPFDDETDVYNDDMSDQCFSVPDLNPTQEKAAIGFLKSSPGTITLVQGPPGTGKSTLLVSIICRYLLESTDSRRLMVCAPTNKAVTVVASRFLRALGGCRGFNVVMVGDVDKLLESDEGDASGTPYRNHDARQQQEQTTVSSLRSIFAYTWVANMKDKYGSIRAFLNNTLDTTNLHCNPRDLENMRLLATRLYQKLVQSLPGASVNNALAEFAKKLCSDLNRLANNNFVLSTEEWLTPLAAVDAVLKELSILDNEGYIVEGLLRSAHVIFCTLASAGAKIFKRAPRISDLIVDEASAATEPELYVPFHLRPKRLLVVGDPQQLPATVMSKRAVALGFDKSLHERLMHDCQCTYTMLDIQYRMKPEISLFPSGKFYGGKIQNGDNVSDPQYHAPVPLLCGKPYYFLQVDGDEEQAVCGSYRNYAEALRVVDLIQNLHRAASRDDSQWHAVEKVRVITFYRAQVLLVQQLLTKRGLPRVLVATVDSSQGCEADLVIISFVRSNNGHHHLRDASSSPHFAAGFLTDDRRVNVALTRAKFQLICIGNVHAMSRMVPTSTLYRLVSNAEERRCVVVSGKGTRTASSDRKRAPTVPLPKASSKRGKKRLKSPDFVFKIS